MDGLMIESHIQPDVALSDAKQQLKPSALDKLLNEIIIRKLNSQDEIFRNKLGELRNIIDDLDEEILKNLSSRLDTVKKIAEFKKDNNVTIFQVSRWDEIVRHRTALGKALGISEEFMKKLLSIIHQESINTQEKIMNE
jgi:chorismate mutase